MKACPFCAEQIQDAAVVCRHCSRDLAPVALPQRGPVVVEQTDKKWKSMQLMGTAVAFLGIVVAVTASTGGGLVLLCGGAAVMFFAKFAAWWHHG